jgi:RNA polymerase sigma factor (sigma-70 family)
MTSLEAYTYRPVLFSIAYRMIGNRAVAEDLVQDTFLNWLKVDQQKILDVKAYLVRSITNTCLNYLDSIKRKKEDLLDSINPMLSELKFTPDFSNIDIKCELTEAISQLYKKLPPAERAVFVLKEVFNFDYADLPEIIGKKADNCRQLFRRAQLKLSEKKERFTLDTDKLRKTVDDFRNATLGEFSNLIEGLKKDIG